MKALIISEDEKVYTSLNNTLVAAGYDTIIYKWLLKALDNIEEIRPDCIVVSSSEYPRHWKTLVQFVKSGIGGDDVDIYLYEPNPISDEDKEKAKILGITGYFDKLENFSIPKAGGSKEEHDEENIKPEEPEIVEADKPDEQEEIQINNSGHFMFTHPASCKFISGKFFDYNGKTMSCSLYDIPDVQTITAGTVINSFTFFDSKVTRMCSAKVNEIVKLVPANPLLIIEISEIYEQN